MLELDQRRASVPQVFTPDMRSDLWRQPDDASGPPCLGYGTHYRAVGRPSLDGPVAYRVAYTYDVSTGRLSYPSRIRPIPNGIDPRGLPRSNAE
jgi:hypothetical protein